MTRVFIGSPFVARVRDSRSQRGADSGRWVTGRGEPGFLRLRTARVPHSVAVAKYARNPYPAQPAAPLVERARERQRASRLVSHRLEPRLGALTTLAYSQTGSTRSVRKERMSTYALAPAEPHVVRNPSAAALWMVAVLGVVAGASALAFALTNDAI